MNTRPRTLRLSNALYPILLALLIVCARADAQERDLSGDVARIFSAHTSSDQPAAAVAVIKNGTLLFKAAYGSADLRTNRAATTSTAFHLASVGKQMTAVAVLRLQEEGKLRSTTKSRGTFLSSARGDPE